MKQILEIVTRDIEKNFYDPSMRGLDWKSITAEARERIEKAQTVTQMVVPLVQMVRRLDDSHTVFLPPQRVNKPRFGFEAKAFGDEIRIYEIKKKGAAESAGLKPGDRIVAINGVPVERSTFEFMMLFYRLLHPVAALDITYSRGSEPPQTVRVKAQFDAGVSVLDFTKIESFFELIREIEEDQRKYRYSNYDGGIGYLELPGFTSDEDFLGDLVGKVKGSRAVIVDLRGNPGGSVDGLAYFSGYFEAQPAVLADFVSRQKTEPLKVRPRGGDRSLQGPLFILVDSESASAAEIFARHFQRIGRAQVIGDRSSGRVSRARIYSHSVGMDYEVPYAVEVADARVVFPGGEELEKRGVTPDHNCLPTSQDLREDKDPCWGLALSLARKALGLAELAEGAEAKVKGENK